MISSTDQSLPQRYSELGIEVPVQSIDQALHDLWDQDSARTNASLINLVVFSEAPGSLIDNSLMVGELTREHACRAILVEVNREQLEPDIRAWITAHCHMAHGQKTVCCEQIALYLTGRVTGRFRNTVFAHLHSDLPLVFWWQGELSDIFSERLVNVMDRLIVDSASWSDPLVSFRKIEEASRWNEDIVLQDHEWSRSLQYRVGVAHIFDEPFAQNALKEIERIELGYHPLHQSAALQLMAWIVVQAGWDEMEGGWGFRNESGGRVDVVFRKSDVASAISSLVFHGKDFTASVVRVQGTGLVEKKVESPNYCASSMSPADPEAVSEIVAMQLARGGRNTLWKKIMPKVMSWMELGYLETM